MFGIGLPELILIMALALIVIGPDKLPDMAKSIAKQLIELKKTANALKDSLQDELKADEQKEDERPWEKLEPPVDGTGIIDAGFKDISVQPPADAAPDAGSVGESDGPYAEVVESANQQTNETDEQEGKKS